MNIPSDDASTLSIALHRVSKGDRRAFEDVYRRTSAKLFGVCLRILPVRQEAEDALQEAYLAVWRGAGSFDESRGNAMTWLITLTRNRAVDRLRAGGKISLASLDLAADTPADTPSVTDLISASQDERQLADCMDRLDRPDVTLIRSAFLEGSTYAELATRAALPLGTVKSRVRRALLRLKACLS